MTYWSSSGGGGLEVTLHVLNCHIAALKNRSAVKQMVCFHHRHHFDRHNWEVASDDMHLYAYIHTLCVCMCMLASILRISAMIQLWFMLTPVFFRGTYFSLDRTSLWTVVFNFSNTCLAKSPSSHCSYILTTYEKPFSHLRSSGQQSTIFGKILKENSGIFEWKCMPTKLLGVWVWLAGGD